MFIARVMGALGLCLELLVSCLCLAEKALNLTGRFWQSVWHKLERWGESNPQMPSNFGAQHSCCALERLKTQIPLFVRAQDGKEHGGVLQITADSNVSDGDIAQIRVAKTLLQPLSKDALDLVG
jgi:hypothetical protein